jgi:glycyl-tRNA synthetase beta chain
LGALLSVADRTEILCAGYSMNMIPTGSRDPYALRRIATGLMKIILEYGLDFDYAPLFDSALGLYNIRSKLSPGEMRQGLVDLLISRFRFLMEQKGISFDHLNAVLAVEQKSFLAAYAKTNALWSKQDSGDLKTLAKGFKRINNIIDNHPPYDFDEQLLQEDGEIRLHRAFRDLEFRVRQNIQVKDYSDALDMMVTLGPEIDNFFDEVLVMSEDEKLRKNRIALLQKISELYGKIADFSQLQIEG